MDKEEKDLDKIDILMDKIDDSAYPDIILKAAKLLAEAGTNSGAHYTEESIIMDLFVSTQFPEFELAKIEEYRR